MFCRCLRSSHRAVRRELKRESMRRGGGVDGGMPELPMTKTRIFPTLSGSPAGSWKVGASLLFADNQSR